MCVSGVCVRWERPLKKERVAGVKNYNFKFWQHVLSVKEKGGRNTKYYIYKLKCFIFLYLTSLCGDLLSCFNIVGQKKLKYGLSIRNNI